ncbi:MAG: hypothetical protein IMX02_09310 [Limnochordaceae bacterium]|nr:hypothetical protein [Limnochordaceae bacterium]
MSRRVDAPVRVFFPARAKEAPGPGCSRITAIGWRGRTLAVRECLDEWRETGRWWAGEGEKHFVRVVTDLGIYELGYEFATGEWRVYRIFD